jgi:hypothetical protein
MYRLSLMLKMEKTGLKPSKPGGDI